jgi:hypothetical protein
VPNSVSTAKKLAHAGRPAENRSLPAWGYFVAWMLVGAGYALGFLSILTIGVAVLAVAGAATVLLTVHRPSFVGLPGVVSGISVPLFYVAYLNRDGPGTVCRAIEGGEHCTDEWSPWPWTAIGVVVLLAGVTLFVLGHRARSQQPEASEMSGT